MGRNTDALKFVTLLSQSKGSIRPAAATVNITLRWFVHFHLNQVGHERKIIMTKRNFLRIVLPVGALAVASATVAPIVVSLEKNQTSNSVIKANGSLETNQLYATESILNPEGYAVDTKGFVEFVKDLQKSNLIDSAINIEKLNSVTLNAHLIAKLNNIILEVNHVVFSRAIN